MNQAVDSPSPVSRAERLQGMLTGSFIGDALAMPVHWYYDTNALESNYGVVRDYLLPRNPHSGSILWRSSYKALNAKGEILHEQAKYWGKRGVHYHQFLQAGENTLNLKLNRILWESLQSKGAYESGDYLERYIAFMLNPDSHRDTYLEEYHRNFFHNYARGRNPERCATEEKHIGGLACIFPVIAFYGADRESGRHFTLERLRATHPGSTMEAAADLLIDLIYALLDGEPFEEVFEDRYKRQTSPFLGFTWNELARRPTLRVLQESFSTVCYVPYSIPAVLYLLYKYWQDPETALIENTMAGGDNCYRGAVLGGLLGVIHGESGFPTRWVEGLVEPRISIL